MELRRGAVFLIPLTMIPDAVQLCASTAADVIRRRRTNQTYRNVRLCSSVFTAYIMLFISDNCSLHIGQVVMRDKLIICKGSIIIIVSAYRYIAITTLAIIAVFLEYLRQFLIEFHQT